MAHLDLNATSHYVEDKFLQDLDQYGKKCQSEKIAADNFFQDLDRYGEKCESERIATDKALDVNQPKNFDTTELDHNGNMVSFSVNCQ